VSIASHGDPSATPAATLLAAVRPAKRLLAAHRNGIAIRVFRAAAELGLRTVAIYAPADGTVEAIYAQVGETVQSKDLLIKMRKLC
jgi:pyruvate carboxylase